MALGGYGGFTKIDVMNDVLQNIHAAAQPSNATWSAVDICALELQPQLRRERSIPAL